MKTIKCVVPIKMENVDCFTGNATKSLREWLSITKEAAIHIWMAAFKRNDDEYYPYYTIRAQDDYTKRKLKFERQHFPNLEVLLDFACN